MSLSVFGLLVNEGDAILALLIVSTVVFLVSMMKKLMQCSMPFHATVASVEECFPNAMTNAKFCKMIKEKLEKYGYGENCLVATSICCDEVNRTLEKDLASMYGSYFSMGGLAGTPFGGVTAFSAMAHHIPDGGSCVIVYGPHVGVDSEGKVGTVNRRGRMKGGSCCGSAVAAAGYVKSVIEGKCEPVPPPVEPLDAQQAYVGNLLLPYGQRLQLSKEPMAELPYALFDAQDELMQKIVAKACGQVSGEGKIAVVGGIQINTPMGLSDYFLPLRFDVIDNQGKMVEKLMGGVPRAAAARILKTFPKAVPNYELVDRVSSELSEYGYGKSSLLCTALCCDEVNRPLEEDFQAVFGDHFNIGGLAGFAFGGATGFGAMAAHIPDGGSCLVVYGPHVGVDSSGKVGTVDRRGRANGGNCCGSAVAAANYVCSVVEGGKPEAEDPTEPLDAQQAFVGKMLLAKGQRLKEAEDKMVELPLALFEAQDEFILDIVKQKCGSIPKGGRIALLGGVQINTPEGMSDFFLPLRFEVRNNQANIISDFLSEFDTTSSSAITKL